MRIPTLFAIALLTLGCRHGSQGGDDTDEVTACVDSGAESGSVIEEVLSGITGYSYDASSVDDFSADCLDGNWEFTAYTEPSMVTDVNADAVYLFVWDLADDALLGGWPLTMEQTSGGTYTWIGSLSADEAGVRCDGAGSATFVLVPITGTVIGTYSGAYMGSIEALGFSTGETYAVFRAEDPGADSVSWRLHDLLGCEDDASGEMESESPGQWKAEVPWHGLTVRDDGPPLVGAWSLADGNATGASCLH